MSNKRIIIAGGVARGASAAMRARRLCEDCETIMFQRGPHVSFANGGLPYFVDGEIGEQKCLLVQIPESLKARFNLDARINTEVVRIDRSSRRIQGFEVTVVEAWSKGCQRCRAVVVGGLEHLKNPSQ
jgi:NADPH-dependent 2,4-dienoyl-CoA reductase/sulfur reductase-like enzyme